MSVPLTINGVTFNYPQEFDTHWGPTLTNWSIAVTNALKPLTGGFLTLPFPTSGIVFRNSTNTANLPLTVNGSNQLTFNGVPIGATAALTNSHIFVGNVSNQPTDVVLSGDATITNTGVLSVNSVQAGSITNAGINATAAIAFSKLISTTAYFWYVANGAGVLTPIGVTANRAVATDSNGLPVASATTATELGYVSGVTSAIQTQLNAIPVNTPSGIMVDFAGTAAPTGWLLCDGSSYSTGTYPALFAAIGYAWGGSGANFNVPNMSRRVSVGSGGSATGTLGNTVGSIGGEETHTLTTPEIPAHNHPASSVVTDPGHLHGITEGDNSNVNNENFTTKTATNSPYSQNTLTAVTGITVATTISNTGGGGSHNNMQPSAVVTKIIKT